VTHYRRAIALRPSDPVPYNNAAWIHTSQGRNLDEALTLARKAHELAPNSGPILDTLGYTHYRRKEYDKAEPLLRKAVEVLANDASVHYHLGLTYYRLGRKDDAIFALRRSLQLDEKLPQAAEVQKILAELRS
jgi:Flp pilus assembly protein TadD